jgi:hypothetical protein
VTISQATSSYCFAYTANDGRLKTSSHTAMSIAGATLAFRAKVTDCAALNRVTRS